MSGSIPGELASWLAKWLVQARRTSVNVVIAGRYFGGRPGESPQRPRDYSLEGDTLVVRFDPTEVLTVVRPTGVRGGSQRELVIPDAAEVRFGWHYYGRPRTPENWCSYAYRFEGDAVHVSVGGACTSFARNETFVRGREPAVALIPVG